jgi:hypothetical protein
MKSKGVVAASIRSSRGPAGGGSCALLVANTSTCRQFWMVTELGWLPLRWNSCHPAGRKTRTQRLTNSKSPINQCITMSEWRSSQ